MVTYVHLQIHEQDIITYMHADVYMYIQETYSLHEPGQRPANALSN